jgi:hypothetical protein
VLLTYPVKNPLRAEQMLVELKMKGLGEDDILIWWEHADLRGHGTPRELWRAGKFDEVERAAEDVVPR